MKKMMILILVALIGVQAQGKELVANMTWCAFSNADNKTYVETYLSVIGNSLYYVKNKNGKYQASIDVLMTFLKDDSIRTAKRYTLNSPEENDTVNVTNFLDLQRIALPVGYYTLQITLTDVNRKPQFPVTNRKIIITDIDPDSVSLSHVEFLESYSASSQSNILTKSGYDLIPYVSAFYPDNLSNLTFYAEIYNTNKNLKADEKFLLLYYIESSTGERMSQYNSFAKLSPQKVNPLLYNFKIADLPSGSYNLVLEVRNSSNRQLAIRKTAFERYNPKVVYSLNDVHSIPIAKTFAGRITNLDTLADYIRSLRPISSDAEADFAENRIKAGDTLLMQQYLYNFWLSRNEANPEAEWLKYNAEVQKVNKEFGTQTMRGYQTDRGRVYLQYGPPDQRVVNSSEPSSYPYEIWQYYHINGKTNSTNVNQPSNTAQTNKRFVFADFDLVTNNYQLIHSDARGEVRDDNWKLRLVKRDNATHNLDEQSGNPQYGGNANDWYNDPH